MPKVGFVSVNVTYQTYDRMQAFSKHRHISVSRLLELMLEDKSDLQGFAKKIKKVPKSVRVYT